MESSLSHLGRGLLSRQRTGFVPLPERFLFLDMLEDPGFEDTHVLVASTREQHQHRAPGCCGQVGIGGTVRGTVRTSNAHGRSLATDSATSDVIRATCSRALSHKLFFREPARIFRFANPR